MRNVGATDEYIEQYLVSHGDVKLDLGMNGFIKKPKEEKVISKKEKNGAEDESINTRQD